MPFWRSITPARNCGGKPKHHFIFQGCCTRSMGSPSQSPTVPALPRGEPLAVHINFISLPRPLPLRKDFPRAGGRCRAATKGGAWHGVSRDGEGEDAKTTPSQSPYMEANRAAAHCLVQQPQIISFYQPNSFANQLTVVSAAVSTVVSICLTVCCSLEPSASLSDQ